MHSEFVLLEFLICTKCPSYKLQPSLKKLVLVICMLDDEFSKWIKGISLVIANLAVLFFISRVHIKLSKQLCSLAMVTIVACWL